MERYRDIRDYDTIDWEHWTPVEQATLMFIRDGERILLIEKKRGLGAGKINGPGGRMEGNETPEECAIRETQEELIITPTGVQPAGELNFQFVDGHSIRGFVFTATGWEGTPTETDEANPVWTPIPEIPFHRMWADDAVWFPWMLRGDPFLGRFLFDNDTMLGHHLSAQPISM